MLVYVCACTIDCLYASRYVSVYIYIYTHKYVCAFAYVDVRVKDRFMRVHLCIL